MLTGRMLKAHVVRNHMLGKAHSGGRLGKDGAVQEQIDASIADAVKLARQQLPGGESLARCEECDNKIPRARRIAMPGVRLCVPCQQV